MEPISPDILLDHIFPYLSSQQIQSFCLTNKHYQHFYADKYLWKCLTRNKYAKRQKCNHISWKQYYLYLEANQTSRNVPLIYNKEIINFVDDKIDLLDLVKAKFKEYLLLFSTSGLESTYQFINNVYASQTPPLRENKNYRHETRSIYIITDPKQYQRFSSYIGKIVDLEDNRDYLHSLFMSANQEIYRLRDSKYLSVRLINILQE